MSSGETANILKAASVALCGCEMEELASVSALLNEMGCVVHHAETIKQLEAIIAGKDLDAIVIHVCPSRQEFLPILGRFDMPAVIPLLRHADKHLYPELLRRGAFDCVPLPVQKGELKRVLTLAIENRRRRLAASKAA